MQIIAQNYETNSYKLQKRNIPVEKCTCKGEKSTKKQPNNWTKNAPPLDKLAQLRRKGRAKFLTIATLRKLIALNSPMRKSYVNSLFCCQKLVQRGQKLTSEYCGNRFCLVCARIRMAKWINGYMPALLKLTNKQFVTLTIPNCSGDVLRLKIKEMIKFFRDLNNRTRRCKVILRYLRKIECTYNLQRGDFHPHFHIIVQGETEAKYIVSQWLKFFNGATRAAQDIRPADEKSCKELFKYCTKLSAKDNVPAKALDTMFRAMMGLRTFQPVGIRKAHVSEEIDDIQSVTDENLTPEDRVWTWEYCDWIDESTGECLTGYVPSEADLLLSG